MKGITISVTSDAHVVAAKLRSVARRQLPFAGSRALNFTAVAVTAKARNDLRRKFKVRNRSGNQGIRTVFMSKRDWPKDGARIEWRDYLAQHEEGGRISPAGGARAFAIPTKHVARKRTGAGKIRKKFKPRLAIASGKASVLERDRQAYVAKNPLKRRSKRRGSHIRLWFLLRRQITLRPVLKARVQSKGWIRQVYAGHFKRELGKAIRSAK